MLDINDLWCYYISVEKENKFMTFTSLGMTYLTRGVDEKMKAEKEFRQFVVKCLERYQNCDWGDLDKGDKKLNDSAVANGDDRVLAKYNYDDETSIYIITEWDRSVTTILFPDEY